MLVLVSLSLMILAPKPGYWATSFIIHPKEMLISTQLTRIWFRSSSSSLFFNSLLLMIIRTMLVLVSLSLMILAPKPGYWATERRSQTKNLGNNRLTLTNDSERIQRRGKCRDERRIRAEEDSKKAEREREGKNERMKERSWKGRDERKEKEMEKRDEKARATKKIRRWKRGEEDQILCCFFSIWRKIDTQFITREADREKWFLLTPLFLSSPTLSLSPLHPSLPSYWFRRSSQYKLFLF